MDITYEPIIIEVKDIRNNILCVLTNDEVNEYKINNIKEVEKINDVRSLEFNISPESENIKYLINENILSVGENEYIIKVCNLQDDDSEQTYSVTAYGYESILKDKICGKYEIIADTPQNLITKVLENTGYIYGGTDIGTNVQRHLFSENESVFSNLISIAENFNARLYFKTMIVNNIKTRSVSLYSGVINNGTYIEKGRDLTSVDIQYSTENMTTRLYVFGQTDKITGTPINMMSVNPTGMAYIDNLSYFTNQGITLSEIGKSPRFIKELVIENNELTTPQMVYNYGVEKIKELCVPSVECSVTAKDLHLIEEYMKTKPVIGETIYIYDEDINFVSSAIIVGISKDYDNPLESSYDISNVIVFNSTIKDLIDTGKVVEKVTNEQGKILGMYIADATIGNAQIGNAVIDNAKIHDLSADKITAGDISTDRLKANTIDAINAYVGTATIDIAKISNLSANYGKINALESDLANINTLVSGHLTSNNIQSLNLTSDKVTVANGFIKDAMIDTLSVNKVLAGDISTSKFRVVSDSGNMIIADNTIQINDATRLRVQIGEDASNDYSMYVWDSNGNLMFDATGLKASGVKDKIIRDDMISDSANISGSKLDIVSLITSINGNDSNTIKGSKIKLDETNQTLEVGFKALTTSLNDNITTTTANTTAINTANGKIDTLISNTTITKVDGSVIQLKDAYNSTVATVNSINSTIAEHTTQINSNNNSVSNVTTKTNEIQRNLDETMLKVSSMESVEAINLLRNWDFSLQDNTPCKDWELIEDNSVDFYDGAYCIVPDGGSNIHIRQELQTSINVVLRYVAKLKIATFYDTPITTTVRCDVIISTANGDVNASSNYSTLTIQPSEKTVVSLPMDFNVATIESTDRVFVHFKIDGNETTLYEVKFIENTVGNYATTSSLSEINVKIDAITQTVTSNKTDMDGRVTNLQGQITTNNNAITQTVTSNKTDVDGKVTNLQGQITTNNNAITQKVTAVEKDITNATNRISSAEQKITSTAIVNSVSTGVNNGTPLQTTYTKLSSSGFEVNGGKLTVTNSNGVVTIDGSSNMFKIHAVADLSLIAPIGSTSYLYKYKHNLGYVPAFIGFQVDSPSSITGNVQLPALTISGGTESLLGVTCLIRATADSSYVKVEMVRATNLANSMATGFKVRLFVYKEALI